MSKEVVQKVAETRYLLRLQDSNDGEVLPPLHISAAIHTIKSNTAPPYPGGA